MSHVLTSRPFEQHQKAGRLKQALLLSAKQVYRSVLSHQLRQIGVAQTRSAAKWSEARRFIETTVCDLIVCDQDLGHQQDTGQSMIDDLRRCGHVDITTIVIMVASSAVYSQVTEAAESGVDSYLLRPFSQSSLQDRISIATHRRDELREIYSALKTQQWDQVIDLCMHKYAKRAPFWLYALRIAAEVHILRGAPQKAQELYQAILDQQALPWARLGVGRALAEQGKHQAAVDQLESTVHDHPELTDAYDIMGRVHLDMGNTEKALEVYKMAAEATPSSVSRVQRLGFAAMYAGDFDLAEEMLQRSIKLGMTSKMFDTQAFFALAGLYAQKKKDKELRDILRQAAHCAESPIHQGPRMDRMQDALEALHMFALGKESSSRTFLGRLLAQVGDETFDFDMGCNVVTLLAMLAEKGLDKPADPASVEKVGARFGHSKLAANWLASSAKMHGPYSDMLLKSHEAAFKVAQDIMKDAVNGRPQQALNSLVEYAATTLNARIIEMAERMVGRYADKIENADYLMDKIEQIKKINDPVVLKKNPTNKQLRHPGGMSLFAKLTAKAGS